MDGIQFFDAEQEISIVWKALPHWAQTGTVCFITWRTADSMPWSVLERLADERRALLSSFGLDSEGNWKSELAKLPPQVRGRVQWSLFTAWDRQLDSGAGECVLARPSISQIVLYGLLHFDGDRYMLTDAVIMPNHVHVLVAFREESMLISQCTSWKRFTGRRIHDVLGLVGEFWQVEQFDHLVRSPEQFEHYRRYIADNPHNAGLAAGTYRWYSKRLHWKRVASLRDASESRRDSPTCSHQSTTEPSSWS
jgi:type I restriction enzyme R subunit